VSGVGDRAVNSKLPFEKLKKASSFTLTGIANTFTDFLVFNTLILLYPSNHSGIIVGYSLLGFLTANFQSYWLHLKWTFRDMEEENSRNHYFAFFLISLVSLLLNSLIFYCLQNLLSSSSSHPALLNAEKWVASVAGIALNYLSYEKIAFRVSGELPTLIKQAICFKKMKGDSPELSLVIPAYNESARIEETLQELIEFSKQQESLEILIVDDGSTDATSDYIRKAYQQLPGLTHYRLKRNWGKGAAVRLGLCKSSGKYVVFCDADLSFPLTLLQVLKNELKNGADVVVGIRSGGSGQPWNRRFLSNFFRKLVQGLKLTPVQDTQCGFKGFRKESLGKILPKTQCCDFTFDIELLALAELESLEVVERVIPWSHQHGSTIRPTHIFQMLYSLLLICARLNQWVSSEFLMSGMLFTLALLIRLPYLYDVPHFIDEWGEVRLASQIARGEIFPLHNTAHDIGAFYNYLLAFMFTLFGAHLFIPRLLVTVFSASTVVLTYLLARVWLARKPAVFAALLLATNSMHILVTHMAWSNDITPFFVVLALLLTIKTLDSKRYGLWALCGWVWAIALQTHSSVLAPLLGVLIYWSKQIGFRRLIRDTRIGYGAAAFLAGYSNMIMHNIINPLDSILWIRHKDYALNAKLTIGVYVTNIKNMLVELARALSSSFPNGTGIMHTGSLIVTVLMAVGFAIGLGTLHRSRHGEVLFYIIAASTTVIPLFNNRYVYFISTRYIAFLFPICYVIIILGYENWKYPKLNYFVSLPWACLVLILPLYHFYSYAAHYIESGEDNSAEYQAVTQLVKLNVEHDSVYVDMGGKQGKAVSEMLRVTGQHVILVGEEPPLKMVALLPGNRRLKYEKWRKVLTNKHAHGWFALSPEHVQSLTRHFNLIWEQSMYVTRSNGEAAYFIGKIEQAGFSDQYEQKVISLQPKEDRSF
jgi:glycosyltransferase involved in cell wall biosynthesis/putative flippase GtrA